MPRTNDAPRAQDLEVTCWLNTTYSEWCGYDWAFEVSNMQGETYLLYKADDSDTSWHIVEVKGDGLGLSWTVDEGHDEYEPYCRLAEQADARGEPKTMRRQ